MPESVLETVCALARLTLHSRSENEKAEAQRR